MRPDIHHDIGVRVGIGSSVGDCYDTLNLGGGYDCFDLSGTQTPLAVLRGTVTSMRCFVETAPNADITFTLRKNEANTTLTCTVASGANTGSGSGSVSFVAGDRLDVAAPANVQGSTKPGTFAIG